ncbi:hypothetical protein Ancab_022460 [Ancistrocladus abbreviatus]
MTGSLLAAPWVYTKVSSARSVWLRYFGVPLQILDTPFFAKLTSLWVSFIQMDDYTRKKYKFVSARILVLMSDFTPIFDSVHVKVNGHTFPIKVVEELGGNSTWSDFDKLCTSLEGASGASMDEDETFAPGWSRGTVKAMEDLDRDRGISDKSKVVTLKVSAFNVDERERETECMTSMQQDSGGFWHTVSQWNPNGACGFNSDPGPAFTGLGHQPSLVGSLNNGGFDSLKSDSLNMVISRLRKRRTCRPKDQFPIGLGLEHKLRNSKGKSYPKHLLKKSKGAIPLISKIGEPPSNGTNLGNPRLSRKSKGEMGELPSNCADLGAAMFVEEGLPNPALFADSLIRPSPGSPANVESRSDLGNREIIKGELRRR